MSVCNLTTQQNVQSSRSGHASARPGVDEPAADSVSQQLDQFVDDLRRLSAESGRKVALQPLLRRFKTLRANVVDLEDQLHATRIRSEALAKAQADAIINSVEIIDELEETKQHLNEARSAAEKAANDTQQLADTIFDRTHDTVLVLHQNICVSCNDNALHLFGCSRSDIVGTWPRPLSADWLVEADSAFQDILTACDQAQDGITATVEVALRRPDDVVVWCEVKATGFLMQEARHILITVCDISSRKQFEEELRRHRDFLDNIINAVPDPLYVSDQQQTLVLANDSYCQAFDVRRDSVIGKSVDHILPTESRRTTSGETSLTSSGAIEEEWVQNQEDGSRRIHAVRRSAFDDRVSGESYTVGISRDITEQRQHQQQLSLLASVFNNAAEGVAILTRDGQIMEANPRLVEMFSCGDVVGQMLTSAVELSISDLANELVRVSLGAPWAGKVSAVLPGGDRHWYWLSLSRNEASECPGEQIIALFSDVTQLENSQRQLQKQALHDNLTGLPNRRFFRQYLEDVLSEHPNTHGRLSICFMDLDEFKGVNDSMGHGMGDQLLIQVAGRLTETIGKQAFIARFGGDEFAAVLPQRRIQEESVDGTVDRLLASFQQPFVLAENEVMIGLSIGIATFPFDGMDVESLMSSADIAMYAAKESGKNHARHFSTEMQERADQRLLLQTELRKVLQGGGISLAFQPKVCAHSGAIRGCEALARWKRPDGTMIPPSEFIPIAEQSGVILPLGEYVIGKALECCRDWADRGIDLFPVAVNISPQQLRSVTFVDRLMKQLEDFDARPEWLDLEITENAMVEDIAHTIEVINKLVDLGFRVAIDDFGTGYSSLSYLRFFGIHTLKIDQSFVSEITNDRNCAAIAESIVSLGRGLGLTVVAEGVETEEQRLRLVETGCDIIQGYLIGRPMPGDKIEEWRAGYLRRIEANARLSHSS